MLLHGKLHTIPESSLYHSNGMTHQEIVFFYFQDHMMSKKNCKKFLTFSRRARPHVKIDSELSICS